MTMRFNDLYIAPGMAVLPERMDSTPARAMLHAIALQESGFRHRRQIRGPARGWWQFEPIGVRGVLEHRATRTTAEQACALLGYSAADYKSLCNAIEHNDMLACAFARLLLWRLPNALPAREDEDGAWYQYIDTWRPGKPHRERWGDNYRQSWEAVTT